MAEALDFLAWSRDEESSVELKNALAAFEAMHSNLKIAITMPAAGTMWTEIVKTALFGEGADIAEVGSTYNATLMGMNALRPFTPAEVASFGGRDSFIQSAWKAGYCPDDDLLWAVPWRVDTRVIFYRRDLLAQAGIDETVAFQTPANMEQTLQRLQEVGSVIPISLSMLSPHALTTFAASWVWGAGGDFINTEGNEVVFDSPQAREGLRHYFSLGRYLSAGARKLDISSSDRLFSEGKSAVTYTGVWMLDQVELRGAPIVKNNLGLALVPGVPIVGGTHLVIWKYSKKADQALELIRYLLSDETVFKYFKGITLLAKKDTLTDSRLTRTPLYQTFIESIKTGRSVPSLPLWAMVEDRFGKTLMKIWDELDRQPNADLDELIAGFVNPLAERLNATLKSSS